MLETLTRNWWTLLLRGVIAILFGFAVLVSPGIALTTMIIFFGVFALVDGVFSVVSSLFSIGKYERWWATFLGGLLSIAVGVIALMWPGLTALAALWLIAFWAIVTGILQIVAAVQLRKEMDGEWVLGLSGVLSLLLGILLAFQPGVGVLSLLWLLGIYAIVFGVLMTVLSFRVRGAHKQIKDTREYLRDARG
jgi:uncharacterized membrane protein HdeD (DUF308 family)